MLPYYVQVFRGDSRLGAAIETAEYILDHNTREMRTDAWQLLSLLLNIRCGFGVAGAARGVAWWALRTALAAHTDYVSGVCPDYDLWSPRVFRDENDWTYCAFMGLTYAANGMAQAIHEERMPYPPKWRVANDEGKVRVQAAVRQALVEYYHLQ
jgi:hypothetical protein